MGKIFMIKLFERVTPFFHGNKRESSFSLVLVLFYSGKINSHSIYRMKFQRTASHHHINDKQMKWPFILNSNGVSLWQYFIWVTVRIFRC